MLGKPLRAQVKNMCGVRASQIGNHLPQVSGLKKTQKNDRDHYTQPIKTMYIGSCQNTVTQWIP